MCSVHVHECFKYFTWRSLIFILDLLCIRGQKGMPMEVNVEYLFYSIIFRTFFLYFIVASGHTCVKLLEVMSADHDIIIFVAASYLVDTGHRKDVILIGVGRFRILGGPRFRILGGQGLEYWGGGAKGGQIPSRHMAS